jgi:TatD DNase family protein
MHCFSGTVDQARRSLDLGFYLSFAGNLTYPKAAKSIREAAAFAPADRILVETDAPFLAPIPSAASATSPPGRPHRRRPRRAPRHLTGEALAALTTANFHALFPQRSQ